MSGGHIEIKDLSKTFGDVVAVNHIDLDMAAGEFFSMLGPSGCGKTTTLRMIAGFENPNSGQILLDGTDIRNTPPHKRPVNTVFQAYMIFPHLNVFENVAFGLRRQRCTRAEIHRRVRKALELVQLHALANRRPSQLSGGQQQRVALARALVLQPAVLLLDEPLGALDAKLRRQLQVELKALQQRVGITFVYVTHDQEEALTMSDRIAVMSHGIVEQVGTPREVYDEPMTEFVADFLGISNMITANASADAGGACRLAVGEFTVTAKVGETSARGPVKCVVRPERVNLSRTTARAKTSCRESSSASCTSVTPPASSSTSPPARRCSHSSRATVRNCRTARAPLCRCSCLRTPSGCSAKRGNRRLTPDLRPVRM